MTIKLLTEHHLEFLSLKRDCTGSSESTLLKGPHCWKSRVTAQFCIQTSKPGMVCTYLYSHVFSFFFPSHLGLSLFFDSLLVWEQLNSYTRLSSILMPAEAPGPWKLFRTAIKQNEVHSMIGIQFRRSILYIYHYRKEL